MKELTARQRANAKWRENNKEYYKEYYKKYRETHKPKAYATIYKKRLDNITSYIIGNSPKIDTDLIIKIARGDYDE